ncbi:MAG: LacI family DNA-binding transcriptional regulator [Actinobacteria bacterium]|nr:LacI family DNA-binding transcriptional regulator [Actinomycetota bacterium]
MADPRKLTSKDIARHAGVSQTTVSLVFRDAADGKISAATQERVRKVAEELGYRPSPSARSLRSGRAHMIGLVIPNVSDPFFGDVLRGSQAAASPRGYTVAMIESGAKAGLSDAIAATRAATLDGLVLHSPNRRELRQAREIPNGAVVLDGGTPRTISWVRYDLATGVRLAIDLLRELGHRRIAHIHGDTTRITFAERDKGIAAAAADLLVSTVEVSFDFDKGRDELEDRIAGGLNGATAAICDSDSLAAMAFSAAQARGVSVPDQLSLIGFNETHLSRALGLTTIALPAADAGRAATEMLLAQLDGTGLSHRLLGVELRRRGSTAAPAATPR